MCTLKSEIILTSCQIGWVYDSRLAISFLRLSLPRFAVEKSDVILIPVPLSGACFFTPDALKTISEIV